MISAFGVAHEVSKSYVPGVGYKSAKKLDTVERHIVRNATLGNKAARKKGIKRPQSGRTEINPGIKTPKGKLKQVWPQYSRHETGRPEAEGFSLPNGRGGGTVFIHRDGVDPKTTYRHEMAHLKPRRNPVTMQERFKDPVRSGREEGRADFIAHGRSSTGSYPGTDEFKRGYNEVQGKMSAAQWKKKNVKKSLFEINKSLLPGKPAKFASHLSPQERRGLKMHLKAKKNAREATIPDLGKLSGFSTSKPQSKGPYRAKQMGKEIRRINRQKRGQMVSPVKGSWRP